MDDGGTSSPGAPPDQGLRIPQLRSGIDPAAFRLDPATTRLIALIDGQRTVAAIAAGTDLALEDVLGRLDALERATLVSYANDAPERPETERPHARGRAAKAPAEAEKAWAAASRGDLKATPALAVLEKAASSSFTGALRFEREGDRIEIHFVKGQPLGITATAERHDHGAMLLEAGRISQDIFSAYRAARGQGAPHAVAALMQAGLTDRRQLALDLTWRGSAILKEAAGWRDGAFALAPGLPFPKGLEQLRLLLPRVRRVNWREARLDDEQVAVLEANRAKYLVPSPNLQQVIAGLRLGAKEAQYVEHVYEKPIQLSQAFTISTLLRSVTKSLLYQLINGGAFELHDINPEGIRPHELGGLEAKLRQLEKDNHFNVLTAHPVSTEREIRQRYERRLAEFDPSLYPGAEPHHLDTLAQIRARLDLAYRVLSDRGQRQQHRRQICSADQLMTFVDLQVRKAEVALKMRGQFAEAIELAVSALDIDAGSASARLLLVEALAGAGRIREAREQLRGIAAVPTALRGELEALRRKIG